MTSEKWFSAIGCVVDVIYRSKKGEFTKRRIRVIAVKDGHIRAFCIDSGAQRLFLMENVLAAELVRHNVS
ncbi:putative DNA-binding transcriptional regulator YafY [Paenibacillus castaneae]|uniref:hypothetical protein n=1 Tax=Paenibacillus castaneae TaxID=474957 RepID=UPI000C99B633|nr:hypothetical protein [Paenibacillus castaneae]NIK75701.1 putative DNA-binding transcriptional regulator YafY [Paenibacillus castaneae]